MSAHLTRTVALTLVGAFSFAAPALAQEGEELQTPRGTMEVVPPPDWSIRKEVDRLDESMREYSSLINNLSTASEDLGSEFQAYLKDPNNTLLASSVEVKMARYAQSVMADFDNIIADQDVLGANFRDLQRKLVTFSSHLSSQAGDFNERLGTYRNRATELEKSLTELSVRIKENPPEDPQELRQLKHDFASQFRRYRLQARYVNGYQRRFNNYQQLSRNVETLAGLFVNLHEKFNEMIENLEDEKQYLKDSIRLQADTLRIKKIIEDGIVGSETSIGNVAEKLSNLYKQVDAFAAVHERINSDLTKFVQSQEVLMDVTRKIDNIGLQGGPIGDLASDMDKAIEAFYDRRGADPEFDGLLGVETPDEAAAAEGGTEEESHD